LQTPNIQPQQRRQYIEDPHERSIPITHERSIPITANTRQSQKIESVPITANTRQPQKIESHPMSQKSQVNVQSKSLHGVQTTNSFNSDDVNFIDDNTSQVTTDTVNSSASTSSIAMRAKARMRRQRTDQRQLPSIPAMSPIGNSTTSSAPSPRTISSSDEPERIASPRYLDDSAQPLSPRSNMRMKRRAEHRNKVRRSNDKNAANVQL
jgi:hypothetical protein